MCVPTEVAVNGDKVPLKGQDFHATSRIKPPWQRASPGSFLIQSAVVTAKTSLANLHRGIESIVRNAGSQ